MTEVAKKFVGAPFGTQSERFEIVGNHPKLNTAGIPTKTLKNKIGPGWYEVAGSTLKRPSTGPGWSRQYETKKMSKIPHILYREEWLKKKEQKRKLGPGSYDHTKFGPEELRPKFQRGMIEMKASRFGLEHPNMNPGPGNYGIPDAEMQKEKQFSRIGLLDAGHRDRSCRPVGCHLPPGCYESKGFADIVKGHVVGLRGPYDVFSTDRSKFTTGHLAVDVSPLGPGQYKKSFDSFVDVWKQRHRKYHGRFLEERKGHFMPGHQRNYYSTLSICPRNPDDPSPCHYEIARKREPAHQQDPCFLMSAKRQDKKAMIQFLGGVNNPVGVGRYNLKFKNTHHGFQSAFKASSRWGSGKEDRIKRERKRFKEIEVEQRKILLEPPGPYSSTSLNIAKKES